MGKATEFIGIRDLDCLLQCIHHLWEKWTSMCHADLMDGKITEKEMFSRKIKLFVSLSWLSESGNIREV